MIPSSFEPDHPKTRGLAIRAIRVRTMLPNIITLLALCGGLTAIRLAIEQKFELAIYAVVFAAFLDGIDGRLARLLKSTSRLGAELDSLADFVNFGVAPALILYQWGLHEFKSVGWIAALVFSLCTALRLARFNVMMDDEMRPHWVGNFFLGIPAPAAAITALLPLYLQFFGIPHSLLVMPFAYLYMLCIALLMVSSLPVFSGKHAGKRVSLKLALPLILAAVLFLALLIAYPWEVLTLGVLVYLVCLPLGWLSYRAYERQAAPASPATASEDADSSAAESVSASSLASITHRSAKYTEPPARLN